MSLVSTNLTTLPSHPGTLADFSQGTSLLHEERAENTIENPYFFVYSDTGVNGCLSDPSELDGWNIFGLSFYLSSGPVDQAQCWQDLDSASRQDLLDRYHAAGIKVVVSAFGSTDEPTTWGSDPQQLASTLSNYVKNYQLDGIDVDYEDLDAMNLQNGAAEQWLVELTQALRDSLPQGQYLLTHAPLAPWFSDAYPEAYHTVHSQVGNLIDFYNVQFYDQGDYTDCNSLIQQSGPRWSNSALMQIVEQGIPANKLVIGKPATASDASDGYIDPNTLAGCVQMARNQGWNGGLMSWQYPEADENWIRDVRSQTWPMSKRRSVNRRRHAQRNKIHKIYLPIIAGDESSS